MRKLFIFSILITSIFIASQELDKEYLDSLPDEIREDILNRAESKADEEKKVYRSIDVTSEVQKFNTFGQREEIRNLDEDLFGSDFFDTMQTSFMPINVPNLDDSYVLGFGDVLNIHIIGQSDSNDTYQLNRDGSISLPEIGKLYLAGLSLSDATELIRSKVSQTFIQTKTFITLTNIRDVAVLVSGDAFNPGVYTVNGSSNILHALSVAGGINEHGSYRSISLIRDNKVIDTLDLYDILIEGKFLAKERLRNGDIIFVNPRMNIVIVDGAFKRPNKFELLDGQFLSEAIEYANGLTPDADFKNITLNRIIDASIKSLPIGNVSQFSNLLAKDGDRVFVRKHSFRSVKIDGSILKPGTYLMSEGDNVFDLIDKAGGYSSNAYPYGAVYTNEKAREIREMASEKLYNEFVDSLIGLIEGSSSGELDIAPLISMAQELKNAEPNGRISINLLEEDSIESNLFVQDKDYLYIPELTNNVFIFGEVSNDGAVAYLEGADLNYYLERSAGIKDSADNDSIYILFPDGTTKQVSKRKNLFANQDVRVQIYPGSVIFVPRRINNSVANRMTAQAYATILGNIGVSLASLSVLND